MLFGNMRREREGGEEEAAAAELGNEFDARSWY